MGAWKERDRTVWSCRLCALPEEDEAAGLEEELRARRLGFVEDARALRQYIQATGCSQEECARRLGRTQPAVANRLRLLRLPEDILAKLSGGALTERHGRALLRLESEALQRLALDRFLRDGMSVAEAESYVDRLAAPRNTPRCAALKDAGIFLQSLQRDLETLRRYGIRVREERRETDTELVLIVHIEKRDCEGGGAVAL